VGIIWETYGAQPNPTITPQKPNNTLQKPIIPYKKLMHQLRCYAAFMVHSEILCGEANSTLPRSFKPLALFPG
jgi:hypothetical protein